MTRNPRRPTLRDRVKQLESAVAIIKYTPCVYNWDRERVSIIDDCRPRLGFAELPDSAKSLIRVLGMLTFIVGSVAIPIMTGIAQIDTQSFYESLGVVIVNMSIIVLWGLFVYALIEVLVRCYQVLSR